MNECAKNYFQANFDEQGHLILREDDQAHIHYKKFYKKVPQDFRALVRCSKKISQDIKKVYVSDVATKSNNTYNQTLLDAVHAGISQNFPLLKNMCRRYHDMVLEKLYHYYIDQKIANNRLFYGVLDTDPAIKTMVDFVYDRRIQGMTEETILQEWYVKEMMQWLCPFQTKNTSVHAVMYELLPYDVVVELPFYSDYRFMLLRAVLDKICLEDQMQQPWSHELFLPCGILKKYMNHIWLQDKLEGLFLKDVVMCKAINFALAICEKEQDVMTQQVGNRIVQYVLSAYQAKDALVFEQYKKKTVVLYEALSYKIYVPNSEEL